MGHLPICRMWVKRKGASDSEPMHRGSFARNRGSEPRKPPRIVAEDVRLHCDRQVGLSVEFEKTCCQGAEVGAEDQAIGPESASRRNYDRRP